MANPARPKVLFVTLGGMEDPSSRVRVLQFVPKLRETVGTIRAVSIGSTRRWSARARQGWTLLLARWADVVVVQKVGSPKFVAGLLRANRRVMYDVDDQVHPDIFPMLGQFERVLVGNPFLAHKVAAHNPAVTLVPTVIDESRFHRRRPPRGEVRPVVIGWIGSTPNLRFVQTIKPAFERLNQTHAGRFVFKIVSGEPLIWDGLPVVNKPWTLADEPADVEAFDVGIMPLIDDEYSRQKCGYKALLSMMMSEPVVLSPVGINGDLVTDGVEGFHAVTADDWHDRLGRLIDSGELRLRQGRAGHEKVMREFSIESALPIWASVLTAPAVEGHAGV